mgnify:CR=1 FL=1
MIGSVAATLLNIGLNYVFIRQFGFIAAGYTTIFCYFVQSLIDYFAMKHVVGESIYNMKLIVAMSLGITIVSIFSNMTYDYYIIRYIAVLVIVSLGVIYHRKLISMFTDLKKGNK